MPKITKRIVDTLQPSPAGRELMVWDTELRGFGVRMMPTGVASYFVYYRTGEGRQRKLVLGRVGTLTPEEARRQARDKLTDAAKGADPSAERHAKRGAMTVTELCDLYLQDAAERVKASTLAMDRSRIETHVKPLIGRLTVPSLTAEDVAKLQTDIAIGKSAKARGEGRGGQATGGKGVASRTIGMLGTILEFAKSRRIIKENPARGVARLPEGKQTRFLTLAEIARLGVAMRQALDDGENPVAIAAAQFLLLTGCRRSEVLTLPLAWVDTETRCIRFRDSKGIRAREVGSRIELCVLGAPALAVLASVSRPEGCLWAFPAVRGDGHLVGLPNVLDRLCARAGLTGVTVHVLRHSFAATAAGLGFSELTIAGLLRHKVPGVTARYAHMPDTTLLAAADRVAGEVWKQMQEQEC
ncbi:site-specific integrase [Roseomonas sp. NAR14]|uniref:Site-specific integrase n=1 Tax=Roseomonas acroporae TaxID=2937791 RepID=A0A9X1YG87_9PROT|nr:site-specific integrase [Roseomonas acroporae]MCK8788132.1 site-specific integrase [Roseomonas acroporae]